MAAIMDGSMKLLFDENKLKDDFDDIDDNLKCPHCHEVYVNPKFLSCMDTFCKRCIEDMLPKPKREDNNQAALDLDNNQAEPGAAEAPPPEPVEPQPIPTVKVTCPTCHQETEVRTKKE